VRTRLDKGSLQEGIMEAGRAHRAELERLAALALLARRAPRPTPADVRAALDDAIDRGNPYAWSPAWHTLAIERWLETIA
jgi:hypothetical protein